MEEYQLRVIEERDQLADRLTKLEDFLSSSKRESASILQQELMWNQLEGMRLYLSALKERIEDFKASQ